MTEWQMYWILKLDEIVVLFKVMFGLSMALLVVGIIILAVTKAIGKKDGDDEEKFAYNFHLCTKKYFFRYILPAFFCSGILFTFIPSTKQMAVIIVGPKIINAVSENEELQNLPKNIVDLANQWVEELKPDKEKSDGQ